VDGTGGIRIFQKNKAKIFRSILKVISFDADVNLYH
jgi:hypothetical protein